MATLIAASNATQVGRGTTHPNHDDEASNFHGDAIEERSAFSFTSKLKGFFNKKTGLETSSVTSSATCARILTW